MNPVAHEVAEPVPLAVPPPLELTEAGVQAMHDEQTLRAMLATLPGVDANDPRFSVFFQ
jgi:hypothetical protein